MVELLKTFIFGSEKIGPGERPRNISRKNPCMGKETGAEEAAQNRGGYSDCQDTFVWRKITFLWKNS